MERQAPQAMVVRGRLRLKWRFNYSSKTRLPKILMSRQSLFFFPIPSLYPPLSSLFHTHKHTHTLTLLFGSDPLCHCLDTPFVCACACVCVCVCVCVHAHACARVSVC